MPIASVASLQLARFDQLRDAGPIAADARPGVMFCAAGADIRAAGTEPASLQAFTFLIFGLHADVDSARQFVADRAAYAPWLTDARETWGGVLQPFRHHGVANYLDPANPCAIFEAMVPDDGPGGPVVAITTAGWNRDGLDMAKVRDFGAGVMAVRMSMTGVPGMHTQHSFFFPGVLD